MKVALDTVRRQIATLLHRAGASTADATLVAECLLDAERRGHASHGVDLLATYLARMRAGGIRTDRSPTIVADGQVVIRLDAQGTLGQVSADLGARMVAERAALTGLAAVAIRNSNHVGMLAAYRHAFQSSSVVGLLLNISGPALSPPGGHGLALGSNAVCLVVPRAEGRPFCIDMGTGVVALGKLRALLHTTGQAPDGWLLDAGGRATADLTALASGGSVPVFGGYKGLCISLIVELLAGALAADTISPRVTKQRAHPDQPMGCAQLFVGFSPRHFGMPNLDAAIEGLRAAVGGSYDRPPDIWFPDMMEDAAEQATASAIELPAALVDLLDTADATPLG